MTIAPFTLKSATTQAAAPFVLGHAFKKGDVPAGSQLVASIADFQVTPKNAWPDGSLKFAVLAGRAALTGGVGLSVALSIGTSAAGTALSLATLKATGITAELACGSFGTVSWATTDWDAPFAAWFSGPKMSSWVYRKAVGADAHLVGWLEVRLWSGGEVEVLPWIENGYTTVAAPTNKSDTYTFTLGGSQRFSAPIDLKHHQRTPLISGAMLSHWLGTDPGVSARHDVAYLQASELVPSYGAVSSTTTLSAILPTTFVPLQKGGFSYDSDYMPSTGYQSPIGLLPAHDVAYLVCADDPKRVYEAVIRNGFSAGRYGIHYREPATNRPLRFSSYPTLVIADGQGFGDTGSSTTNSRTPVATGGNPPSWDSAHHPSVGYMAYLVTGRYYFMEQIQFAATANYLNNGDNSFLRTGALGLHQTAAAAHQTRSCAWDWRTHAQALSASPDDDTIVRPELVNSYVANIDAFHTKYAGQTNNPGWIYPGENYGQQNLIAAWQQDFVTMAWGMALCLDLPIPTPQKTKEAALFQWKAKSVAIRLDATAYNNTPYVTKVAASDNPNYIDGTGVFYQSGAEINTQTLLTPNGYYATTPPYYSSTQNVLAIEDPSLWGYSMNSQILAAAAYAVRHGVANAAAGRNRVLAAANYSSMSNAFNTKPVWSVTPSTTTSGASTVTTPGPSVVMDSVSLLGASMAVLDTHRGLGVPLTEVPTGGADGTAPLRDMIQAGDNPLSEIRWAVTRQPPGTLLLDGLGGFSYSGAAGSFDYEAFVDGASVGTATIELVDPSTITSVIVAPSSGVVASGATRAHSATVSGTGSPSQSVTWTTTLGSINSATGLLTAPAATGATQTGTITARSAQDTTKTGTATFTVLAATSTVSGVTVSPSAPSVSGGATQAFAATVAGTFTPSQAVNWTSSAGSISSSGLFTAPAAGSSAQTITITATSVQDGTKSGTATVTVPSAASTVSGVSVLPASASLTGGQAQTFTATVDGTFSPSQAVTWSTTLGTIDPATGVLTAPATTSSVQSGTVTATSVQNGTKAGTASFTVAAASAATVASVTVSPLTVTLAGGATQAFAATVSGANNPSQAVTWSTSAGAISSSGTFTAPAAVHAVQTITITARSSIDNTKTGSATVQVAGDGVPITVAPNRVLRTAAGNRILRG